MKPFHENFFCIHPEVWQWWCTFHEFLLHVYSGNTIIGSMNYPAADMHITTVHSKYSGNRTSQRK